MSFITPAPTDAPTIITNDGWFPDIDLARVRTSMRLDGTVTTPRLIDAVVAAIIGVNTELAAWQTTQRLAGWTRLAEVPAPHIGGQSMLLSHYYRAVDHRAKAEVTAHYRDFDSTKSGTGQAAALEATLDDDRRTARWAMRDLLGVSHTTVALI